MSDIDAILEIGNSLAEIGLTMWIIWKLYKIDKNLKKVLEGD